MGFAPWCSTGARVPGRGPGRGRIDVSSSRTGLAILLRMGGVAPGGGSATKEAQCAS
jgi:hypothetical protein